MRNPWNVGIRHALWNDWCGIKSLASERCGSILSSMIFTLLIDIQNDSLWTRYGIALTWFQEKLSNTKSTFVQVMAWCRQAISQYLHKYWLRFVSPYGFTRLQCIKADRRRGSRPRGVLTHLPIMPYIQYIPRNMHTVFALLCFVVVIHWLIFSYPSGLLHWHCGNLTIAPVPAKQPWWIWINNSCEFIMNDYITTTKQSTTKPYAYFLGYTVCVSEYGQHWFK